MIFEHDLTVPANTAESSRASTTLTLEKGIVHQLDVLFPFGCNGEVLVVIKRGQHQVWPSNGQGQLKGDGFPITGKVWLELEEEPFELTAEGWSPDTTYPHVVTIRLWMQRREILEPGGDVPGIIRRVGAVLLGRR